MIAPLTIVKTFRVTPQQWARYQGLMRRGGYQCFTDLVLAGLQRIGREIDQHADVSAPLFPQPSAGDVISNDTPAATETVGENPELVVGDQAEQLGDQAAPMVTHVIAVYRKEAKAHGDRAVLNMIEEGHFLMERNKPNSVEWKEGKKIKAAATAEALQRGILEKPKAAKPAATKSKPKRITKPSPKKKEKVK